MKEMRLAGIDSIAAANHFLEMRFLPEWEQRFTVTPRSPRNAHRRLGPEHRLEEIFSVRAARRVAQITPSAGMAIAGESCGRTFVRGFVELP